MKIRNEQNNVENNIRSILLDDGHFLFRLKKKSTSSTWSYFKAKNKKGITLIALIITIILMLILAGIVLSLALGKNGLINTAKYAVKKNEGETAREKLEIVLADLQACKYTDETYNENEYINKYLINEEIPISENIAFVDGWRFEIDRTLPKISESLGKGELESIAITTPYVGTTSFTTKNVYVYNEEEIESYTYKIDGIETKTITQKEYTTENELEPESTHTVQVIAKYKDGNTIESNTITVKTEPRTYLYNNGDECIDITGGWKAEEVGSGNSAIVIKPSIDTNSNGTIYAYITSPANNNNYYGGSIMPANKIDYTKYKKVCFKITASVGNYTGGTIIDLYANSEEMIMIDRICGAGHRALNNEIVKYNINQIENIKDLYIYMQAKRDIGGAYCTIYEVWLEK